VVAHNVDAQGGIFIIGLPGTSINDVSLSNIFIDYQGGGTAQDAARVVPDDEKGYPEPSRFGKLPAWGLFARHAKNLAIDRVEFRVAAPDLRPVVQLEDVADASFDHSKLPPSPGASALVLKNVTGVTLTNNPGLSDTKRTDPVADEKI
jgi:hypothetical protein